MLSRACGHVTIPVETLIREFDAKLLLACVAAEQGFSVVVGSKREINHRIGSLPRSIYMGLQLTRKSQDWYDFLHRLGHSVVSVDEEALVHYSPEIYWKTKVGPETLGKTDALFAWGSENARIWRNHPNYPGTAIHVTGNPRVDLLRPELRDFWFDRAQKIRDRFGRFIIINTNFNLLNHKRSGWSEHLNTLKSVRTRKSEFSELDTGLAAHKFALFQAFQEMVGAVAKTRPDCSIVVRPHPAEKHEIWSEAAAGCSNVHIVHEGNAAPWLLASEALIHNGCTTALEAYVLGTPVIAYQPVTSEGFDQHLPNGLSYQALDLQSLLGLVDAALDDGLKADQATSSTRRKLIEQHVTSLEGSLASEKIVEVLQAFDGAPNGHAGPPITTFLGAKAKALRGQFKRRLKKSSKQRRNKQRSGYHSKIFPDVALAEVQSRIECFQRLLGRFSKVNTRRLSENIFEVTAR